MLRGYVYHERSPTSHETLDIRRQGPYNRQCEGAARQLSKLTKKRKTKSMNNRSYNSNKNTADNIVLNAVLKTINNGSFQGTMTSLSKQISKNVNKEEVNSLPRSPSSLRQTINRIVNRLRARGISVKFSRTTDHAHARIVSLSK